MKEIVIKIPEEYYIKISNSNPSYSDDFALYYAIKNGTPLPKGHGPLLDGDELLEHAWRDRLDSRERIAEMIENMPPIIPADKEKQMRRCPDKACEYNTDGVCTREEANT